MFKILHTADWHLGQKLIYYDRQEEHELALDWLLNTIVQENVDLLIIAGDVFDISNPPNYARKLYYSFLRKLLKTNCRFVIIIGGNHDSPSMLNAPAELLETLNIHVVGCATENATDEIIQLKNEDGVLEATVAAVPFLRDRDLRSASPMESGSERIEKLKENIVRHYQIVASAIESLPAGNTPVIATGHLYARGASSSEKQNNIYIGNMDNIEANQFPGIFDYIALGHIHRPQKVGGKSNIRYSGSLIPLSFSEVRDRKSVCLVEWDENKVSDIREIDVPVFRKLVAVSGSMDLIQLKLKELDAETKMRPEQLTVWCELIIDSEHMIPNLDQVIREITEGLNVAVLKYRLNKSFMGLDAQVMVSTLDELTPMEVFIKKCESEKMAPEQMERLQNGFMHLMELLNEEKV